MGAVADAVSDLGSSVSDAVSSVGDAVQDVGQSVIDEVVQPVVKTVEKTVQAALDDPIATAARVAAIAMAPATGGASLAYLPVISAVDVVAKGGSIEDGLKAAAITYVSQGVASEVSNYVNTGVDSAAAANTYGTDVGSQQSNMLAAQESGMGTAGDVAGNIAGKIAGGTAAGIVRGQDPLVALKNAGISAGTAAVTDQIPGFDQLSPGQKMAVNATVSAALMGGDPSQALVNAAINAGISEVGQQIKESNSSGLKAGATGQNESVFDPTFAGTMPANQPTTTADLADQVLPKGVQVAGPLDSASFNKVDVSGKPIYAESPAAKEYKPPFGYRLLSSAEADNKPAGSFYDPTTNAWLAPDMESVAGLQKSLMNEPETKPEITPEAAIPVKPNEVPVVDTEFTPDLKTSQEDFLASIGINPSSVSGMPAQQTDPLAEVTAPTPPVQTTASDQAYFDAIGIDPNSLSSMPAMETDPLADIIPVTQQPTLAELSKSLTSTPTSTSVASVKVPTSSGFNFGNAALIGGAALGLGALASDSSSPAAQAAAYRQQVLNWNARPVEAPIDGAAQGQAMLDPRFAAKGGLMSLAGGGALGGYSDGGRLLKGPGDGMSDHIPASISNKQPARLADGEFVIPADVVSHLGNGSTDAGAKVLYKMMDQVRRARTGNPKQGKQIKPQKFIPK
jgi:hypothetical protein